MICYQCVTNVLPTDSFFMLLSNIAQKKKALEISFLGFFDII